MASIRVGISGWTYPAWGVFYPQGLARARELHFASRRMGPIEINGPFYSLRRPSSYARWRAARIRAWHAGGEPGDAARLAADQPPAADARDV